ncbi:MAG: glycosyltransferase family 4 protein [Saprospiraceae bacterium]|jgi:glycosyltransferase involved in cell wall biosynthesis|nr:glycosyltransferase family 4 protein [Saprospiraceae bacterium]
MDTEQRSLILAFDAKRLFNNFTGLGNYSRTLLKNLQYFYPQNEYHLFTPKITKNKETEFFIDHSAFTVHTPERFSPFWRTYGMSEQINALKPDIFHGLSHEIPFGINNNVVKIVTFHDLIYEKYPEQFNWLDLKMYKWKYRMSAKRADHIIAISKSTKDDLVALYDIPAEKISVVYQSCNEVFQIDDVQDFTPDGVLKKQSPYYLYVGSIIERKGLLQTVIAYAGLPQTYRKPFIIVGGGDKDYIKKVKDLIKYYQLEPDFHFISGIPNQELVTLYDHCYALVYPSVYEGFGIPIIECLFRGKPVITSDISSMPEAAGNGALLINPFSPESISNAMIHLHDEKTYKNLTTQGWQHVVSHFSSDITAHEMMEMYHSLNNKIDQV